MESMNRRHFLQALAAGGVATIIAPGVFLSPTKRLEATQKIQAAAPNSPSNWFGKAVAFDSEMTMDMMMRPDDDYHLKDKMYASVIEGAAYNGLTTPIGEPQWFEVRAADDPLSPYMLGVKQEFKR